MDKDERVIAIIQARMGSKRLPGKVLKIINQRTMLGWVVERTKMAKEVDEVIVATTNNKNDDSIVAYCKHHEYKYVRGSEYDVLDRFCEVLRKFPAEVVVRITADCPFVDPVVIDKVVCEYFHADPPVDFVANRLPPPWDRTFPVGLDTEVVSTEALSEAWSRATKQHQREHVLPYIYEHPHKFNILLVDAKEDYSDLRWTVDTEKDLELVREIAGHFGDRINFSWMEILDVYHQIPALTKINKDVNQKSALDVDDRLL